MGVDRRQDVGGELAARLELLRIGVAVGVGGLTILSTVTPGSPARALSIDVSQNAASSAGVSNTMNVSAPPVLSDGTLVEHALNATAVPAASATAETRRDRFMFILLDERFAGCFVPASSVWRGADRSDVSNAAVGSPEFVVLWGGSTSPAWNIPKRWTY